MVYALASLGSAAIALVTLPYSHDPGSLETMRVAEGVQGAVVDETVMLVFPEEKELNVLEGSEDVIEDATSAEVEARMSCTASDSPKADKVAESIHDVEELP